MEPDPAPLYFTFYEDKPPFKQLQRMELFLEEFYEHAIVVKQLQLTEPNTFAVVLFFMAEDETEVSCTLIFNRHKEQWSEPIVQIQEKATRGELFLRNCFHVDTDHGQKFLYFTDENMVVREVDDCTEYNLQAYKHAIDRNITQCYICREDYHAEGSTFLLTFQVNQIKANDSITMGSRQLYQGDSVRGIDTLVLRVSIDRATLKIKAVD